MCLWFCVHLVIILAFGAMHGLGPETGEDIVLALHGVSISMRASATLIIRTGCAVGSPLRKAKDDGQEPLDSSGQ